MWVAWASNTRLGWHPLPAKMDSRSGLHTSCGSAGNRKQEKVKSAVLPPSAPALQKEPSLRCNHVFYWSPSLYMSIICPEEDFDIRGDSFEILATSGGQGLSTAQPQALLPCVFLPVEPPPPPHGDQGPAHLPDQTFLLQLVSGGSVRGFLRFT